MTTTSIEIDPEYPLSVYVDGEREDSAANVETVDTILYGDLSYHPGVARTVYMPAGEEWDETAERIEWLARINEDCWGIPLDVVERVPSEEGTA